MYKKFALLMPLVALLLGACHNDNDTPGPTICPTDNVWSYTGQLDVTPLEGSPFTAFAESDIVFTLAPADEKTHTLMIPKIKFVEQMPVYISFDVRGIELIDDEKGGFAFSIDETIPYRNGAPYDPDGKGTYTIRNLRGSSPDGATLSVSFDCYTMHVDYRGNR